jgi:hypothetical protein
MISNATQESISEQLVIRTVTVESFLSLTIPHESTVRCISIVVCPYLFGDRPLKLRRLPCVRNSSLVESRLSIRTPLWVGLVTHFRSPVEEYDYIGLLKH